MIRRGARRATRHSESTQSRRSARRGSSRRADRRATLHARHPPLPLRGPRPPALPADPSGTLPAPRPRSPKRPAALIARVLARLRQPVRHRPSAAASLAANTLRLWSPESSHGAADPSGTVPPPRPRSPQTPCGSSRPSPRTAPPIRSAQFRRAATAAASLAANTLRLWAAPVLARRRRSVRHRSSAAASLAANAAALAATVPAAAPSIRCTDRLVAAPAMCRLRVCREISRNAPRLRAAYSGGGPAHLLRALASDHLRQDALHGRSAES
jgi:hypothetical protein